MLSNLLLRLPFLFGAVAFIVFFSEFEPDGEQLADYLQDFWPCDIVNYLLTQTSTVLVMVHVVTDDVVETLLLSLAAELILFVHLVYLTVLVWLHVLEGVKPLIVLFFKLERNLIFEVSGLLWHLKQAILEYFIFY